MTIALPTIVTFIGYLMATLAIGYVAYRATDTLSDYILGGRQLGPAVTALSVGASDMSGWLLLGLPGAIYLSGASEVWIGVGLVLGAFCNWLIVAPRLRQFTANANDSLTLPEFFENRFKRYITPAALYFRYHHLNILYLLRIVRFSWRGNFI